MSNITILCQYFIVTFFANLSSFQGKLDWSKHEQAWANILHREIFETGRYFKKNEITPFKNKNKNAIRKCRESSEEDEGFEVW